MKSKGLAVKMAVLIVAGCFIASGCAPVYMQGQNSASPQQRLSFPLNNADHTYYIDVKNDTPFAVSNLPQTEQMLYSMDFDQSPRKLDADIQISVDIRAYAQEDAGQRIGQMLAGALVAAALGAAAGAIGGDAGMGAAMGAVIGGGMGAVAPATKYGAEISISISGRDGRSGRGTYAYDISNVPAGQIGEYIDGQIASAVKGSFY